MMNPAEFANIAATERDFWWYQGMLRILMRVLQPHVRGRKWSRVLEAGSGTGYFACLMQKRGWPVTPVDLCWEGLRYGREMGVERQTQADIAALPFPDATFDAAISLDVIVHFPLGQEGRAFAEISRVLRPGGLAVIRVSALDILRSRHSEFAHERQRFSRSRLLQQAQNAGIRVLRCTYANSLLMPVAFAKFRVVEPLLNKPPSSGVEPVSPLLNRLLYFPLWLESLWLGGGLNFSLGQSLILIGEKA
jgi:SAM-dependent methyltransferase